MSQGTMRFSLVLAFFVTLQLLAFQAIAQTWQKQGKVSLPVVTLGGACDLASDSIGLTSDRTQLLSCQSGVWKKQSASISGPAFNSNYGSWYGITPYSGFTNNLLCFVYPYFYTFRYIGVNSYSVVYASPNSGISQFTFDIRTGALTGAPAVSNTGNAYDCGGNTNFGDFVAKGNATN